jgi:O-antigen/teichoic acid export membrane protein
VGAGVGTIAVRQHYATKDDGFNQISEFISSCFLFIFSSVLFFCLIVFLFGNYIENFFNLKMNWLLAGVCVGGSNALIQIRLGQWQAQGRADKYCYFIILQAVLNIGLTVFLVLAGDYGAAGRMIAQTMSVVIFFSLALWSLQHDGLIIKAVTINLSHLKKIAAFSIPLLPHASTAFLLVSLDRVVVQNVLGAAPAGGYIVAAQVCGSIGLIFDSINKALTPLLFENLNRNEIKTNALIVKSTYISFLIIIILNFVFFVMIKEIIPFIAPDYIFIESMIFFLVLNQSFSGMYYLVCNYIFFAGRTLYLSVISLLCGLLNFGLLMELVPKWGLEGAALSVCISGAMQFLFAWALSARLVKMPWFRPLGTRAADTF